MLSDVEILSVTESVFFFVRFFQGTADDDDVYNAANTLKRIAVLSR